ncbi:MAG: DUF1028 domain-containing protein [Asgard group archaeon]|nr:DUF1028 domain-containing protein [Asgard group archaeon]
MTFSIVAIDKENKEVGFAIASCAWNAGMVCRAKPEVGAMASQAQGRLFLLDVFFEQLNENKSLEKIMAHFREIDEGIESRQIGMVTFAGGSFGFTGKNCPFWAGHKTGKNYSCQGNILVGPEVIDGMVSAFESTAGSLTAKLYAALKAGDDAGGDARGKQSAKLFICKTEGGMIGDGIITNYTIEDHDEPVKEIGRLLSVENNLRILYGFYGQLQKAETKEEKIKILDQAADFLKDKQEARYIDIFEELASIYFELGEIEKAILHFKIYLKIAPRMVQSFKEYAEKIGLPDKVLHAILN